MNNTQLHHKKLSKFTRWLTTQLFPAWLVTFAFASLFHTICVLVNLSALDVFIPWYTWLTTIGRDFVGLLPTYGVIIAVALLIAFATTIVIIEWYQQSLRLLSPLSILLLFSLSGSAAIAATLLAMQPILDITLIAGSRGVLGFILQCGAGLLGGALFGLKRVGLTRGTKPKY